MIDKLDIDDQRPEVIIDKINELIDTYNNHTHKHEDGLYIITSSTPKGPNDE